MTEKAPALHLLLREIAAFAKMRTMATIGTATAIDVKGHGHHVIVIPGFMASDRTTARLRRSLNRAGFVAHGWGLGRNVPVKADIFDRLDRRLDHLNPDHKVTLIGWSLGGLVAREYAKHAPHRISRVITLGSPFSGNLRANNAWRAYQLLAGHTLEELPIPVDLPAKPEMQTYAFWSARDGVVAPRCASGLQGERDEQIEVDCSHMGFVATPAVIARIAEAIKS